MNEISTERAQQDRQWGGPAHDNMHAEDDWLFYIKKQMDKARDDIEADDLGWRSRFRQRLIKIAALSVAAIESIDRVYPSEPSA